jgi:hypothetical protein
MLELLFRVQITELLITYNPHAKFVTFLVSSCRNITMTISNSVDEKMTTHDEK